MTPPPTGKYDVIPASEMAVRKYGKLRMRDPVDVYPGSGKRLPWICDCGREKEIVVHSVVRDGTSSCGRCGELSVETMSGKFGSLRMKEPKASMPSSHERTAWICDCGKETVSQTRYVVNGVTSSCGRCTEVSADEVARTKYGSLRMVEPRAVLAGSNEKVRWSCSCGGYVDSSPLLVLSGRTKTCGRCSATLHVRFDAVRDIVRSLRTPIEPGSVPDCCPRPLETIRKVSMPFRAECRLCGREYRPKWSGIRDGVSLTCGCSTSRVSAGQSEIHAFATGLGLEAVLEARLNGLAYDVHIPSKNLVIEFNGLRWHSLAKSRTLDLEKYRRAAQSGIGYLMLFEDEWSGHRKKFEALISSRLGALKPAGVRPSACELVRVRSSEADSFYEENHYIGGAMAPINYAVRYGGRTVACASFKRPTRQSSHDWELVRMASVPDVRVHGVWSKVLKAFLKENAAKSVVSFSDRRLFDGGTYERLGFRRDGDVRPDYFWCKGSRRHHKSVMRKKGDEVLSEATESELRTAQGYRKIWDVGKVRWVLDVTPPSEPGEEPGPSARYRR